MEYVFALIGPVSVASGNSGGEWVTKDEAWFADDPFVQAHPDMFSAVPPRVRSTTGRTVEQVPLSQLTPTPRAKGRANG